METDYFEAGQKQTVDFIEKLPEGVRAELIDGEVYYMASPTITHQRVLREISVRIHSYIREKGGLCEVMIAPGAVYLMNDERNYVEPDVYVICDSEKLDDKGCHGAPDWAIEIVSPGSKHMDYILKLKEYKKAGVREYWIVDTDEQKIVVYNFEHGDMKEYSFSEQVPAGIYEDFRIDFSEIAALLL